MTSNQTGPRLKGPREAREAAGVPVQTAAAALGVHRNTIARWESGERIPSAVDLLNMVHLYKLAPTDLYILAVWCWTQAEARLELGR